MCIRDSARVAESYLAHETEHKPTPAVEDSDALVEVPSRFGLDKAKARGNG